ncbi:hypothetical protein ACWD5R_27905 [Streptomyces sp. NPDC002514]|uniref:hypothetical protein n=1 Tax=Streptomyces sp. NPDC001270 TaxID=3364554 RepID=UPI0036949709
MECTARTDNPVGRWTLAELPRFNNLVLAGEVEPEIMVREMNRLLLTLPQTDTVSHDEARTLLVELGMWGSSVAMHFQRRDLDRAKNHPSTGLDQLAVGYQRVPFLAYFAQLATASGTGHPNRDAYASLIKWNSPDMRAYWSGECVARIPSVYEDGITRTYTGDIGEVQCIELFDRCETLEMAANRALRTIWEQGCSGMEADEIRDRFNQANHMLMAARRLMLDFQHGDERGSMSASRFMDVFRQFAVHWEVDDVPPSGTQDIEFITRDLMSGIQPSKHQAHIRKIYPGLLSGEREQLNRAMQYSPLPYILLDRAGITKLDLDAMSDGEIAGLLSKFPEIAGCYLWLRASAMLSATHLMLSKKFLYKPARQREEKGTFGRTPVPNDRGITGLPETALDRTNDARKHHPLFRIGSLGGRQICSISGMMAPPDLDSTQALSLLGISLQSPVGSS